MLSEFLPHLWRLPFLLLAAVDDTPTPSPSPTGTPALEAPADTHFTMRPALHTLTSMVRHFIANLPAILIALFVFAIFVFIGRAVRSMIQKITDQRTRHRHLGLILGRLAQAGCVTIGLLISLVISVPSFQPAQLLQLLGVSSVAIGFAFRDILQNFLSGLLLLITEPFRIGDQILVDKYEGVVEDIKTRATTIRTYDGRRVVIPNSDLFTKSVTVNTAYDQRRVEHTIGIGYSDDVQKAKTLILEALKGLKGVLEKPAPDVLVSDLADSTVTLRVRWWITPPLRSEALLTQDRVLMAIKETLTANGIDLPYPTQQVLFHDQTEESDGDRTRQREGWPSGGSQRAPKPRAAMQSSPPERNNGGEEPKEAGAN